MLQHVTITTTTTENSKKMIRITENIENTGKNVVR